MKIFLHLFIGAFLAIAPMQDARQKIVGKWKLENGLDMEIYQQNDKFYGKIIALNGFNDGQKLDEHNPDKSLRSRSLIGLVILKDLEYDEEDGACGTMAKCTHRTWA